ncbi:cytochrome P-450 like protein [Acidocella aquatica]|uniref:Cytochrome P-450 like protein n=1 Tax=Acidocella aquatica TaxID=1922313 RepID=A0ABQ6A320_9PROT|nr:cytochrome P450 [Acidocella aquatica]GLR66017.1 cytochrome P-450 like protein [Acidocella aquatica]
MQVQSQGHDINLSSLPTKGDVILSEINQLRDFDPLYWSIESQCWIVSGHAEATEGFSGELPLSSTHIPASLYRAVPPEEFPKRLPNTLRYMSKIVTNLDGAEHANLRRLLVKALNRKLVESLRPYVRARVSELLDKAEAFGQIEFHEGISRMLPGAVILRLLGMAPEYLSRLKGWADGVTAALTSFNPEPAWLDRLEVITTDMLQVFQKEIEDRRINPREDLITQLLNTTEGDARLTMDEVLATLLLVIIAGHDTTNNSLTLGIRALAAHPQAWAYWRAHPEKSVDNAVELMRYIAMSTALPRIVSEDFEWHGRRLKQGQLVMLMIAGGNRDPKVYTQPEVLDFNRPNDRSLTFGPGLHHCIGHLLAKLQLSEFFNAMVERFDGVEIIEEPQFTNALVFRSVAALNVRFRPRMAN